jgi:hypothetical protein
MTNVTTGLAPAPLARRVFDCCLFNGETDVLVIRFHELNDVVDHFVIVESNLTFSGAPRQINFDPCHPSVAPFAAKVRHVVVADMPETSDPWVREAWQRNAVLRGVPDAAPTDLLILSDADEIPRSAVIAEMVCDHENESFGFRMAFHYFYVNYRNIIGPEANLTWTVAATRRQLNNVTPDALRYGVRDGKIPARLFDQGGWHFSYLMDEAGIRQKIAAFSHQEFNNEAFLRGIDIAAMLRDGRDLFERPGFVWKLLPDTDLPAWLRQNRSRLQRMFHPASFADRVRSYFSRSTIRAAASRQLTPPIVICPYLYDNEPAEIRSKFDLDGAAGRRMDFFLWQDKERIGPELAFEHCWNQFPDRDIIIIHSDMSPMPGEPPRHWYDALCGFRETLSDAGMLACNLFYPTAQSASVSVQCAGGTYTNGLVDHLHGPLVEALGSGQGITRALLASVRPVDWVTFGGVLIRREVIRACGGFDRRYQWAYMMDVDYSFEARLRGFRLVQVPVSLQHEANRTTRRLWEQSPELKDHINNNMARFYTKWAAFHAALPSETVIATAPASVVMAHANI